MKWDQIKIILLILIPSILVITISIESAVIYGQRQKLKTLKREKNLIVQDMRTLKLELTEKDRIYREYKSYMEELEKAVTLQDYIKIWKELDKRKEK